MKKYASCRAEQMYMLRRTPRSYDMSRTHIMHKSVNRHVDVVLKCAPKNWKKKKVKVHVVGSSKKAECVRIRVNAKKGYIAVKSVRNEDYDRERKQIAAFDAADVVRYDKESIANGRALIHDIKSQISIMADKSADYIDDQLTAAKAPAVPEMPKAPAQPVYAVSEQPKHVPAESKPVYNPYASDYSKHVSNAEFHSLMDSLEKSLDEACKKYSVGFAQPEPDTNSNQSGFVQSVASGYPASSGFNVSVSSAAAPSVTQNSPAPQSTFQSFNAPVNPLLKDEEEEFKPINMFPKDEEEEFKPINMFPKDEEEEFKPINMFPKDEEEEFKPINMFPKDEEEEYKPINMFPKDEEEEFKPINMFPKDEEEEYKPINTFTQDEPSAPVTSFPQIPQMPSQDYSAGYSPNPVSGPSYEVEPEEEQPMVQKFFSRTGDQIKKVIGIIRGKTSRSNYDEDYRNENVEISYSDDDGNDNGYY